LIGNVLNFLIFIGKTAKRQYRDGARSENEGKGEAEMWGA
jgi:hypothetical protein